MASLPKLLLFLLLRVESDYETVRCFFLEIPRVRFNVVGNKTFSSEDLFLNRKKFFVCLFVCLERQTKRL